MTEDYQDVVASFEEQKKKIKKFPLPHFVKDIIKEDKRQDQRSIDIITLKYQTRLSPREDGRVVGAGPRRVVAATRKHSPRGARGVASVGRKRNSQNRLFLSSPNSENSDLDMVPATTVHQAVPPIVAESSRPNSNDKSQHGIDPWQKSQLPSVNSKSDFDLKTPGLPEASSKEPSLKFGIWSKRLKENADKGADVRNRMSLEGRQKKHSEFMLKKYMHERASKVKRKQQERDSRAHRSNVSRTRPSMNEAASNERTTQISSNKNLSPRFERPQAPFLARGGAGSSLPKLDNVFKLDRSAKGIFPEKDNGDEMRMPKLQTQNLGKRNQLNRISPGEIPSYDEPQHKAPSVHSSSIKVNGSEVGDGFVSSERPSIPDIPWQTDRQLNPAYNRNSKDRISRNFREIQRSEGAQDSTINHISAVERGIYVDTLEDDEDSYSESLTSSSEGQQSLNENLLQLKVDELTNLQALKIAVRQKNINRQRKRQKHLMLAQQVNTSRNFSLLREDQFISEQPRTSHLLGKNALQRQKNIYEHVKAEKHKIWEGIATKLAFRQFLKEKGIEKSANDLNLQEIYNRYFFFRKEEINKNDKFNQKRFSPRKTRSKDFYGSALSRSMINFEDLKSRDSLRKFSKESMVSSPLDMHQRSKMVDDLAPSLYTQRKGDHVTSVDNVTNLKTGITSQSLLLDKLSVKEIMDSCTSQIGPAGYVSLAKKDLTRFNQEKSRTDDAMDRLMQLYVEYCDQLQIEHKPSEVVEAKSSSLRKFLINFNRKRQTNTFWVDKDNLIDYDEKSVDLLMREELHQECMIDRCFDSPSHLKQQVTVVNRKYQPNRKNKTKNPIFWKPEPIRFSKHLQELLEAHSR